MGINISVTGMAMFWLFCGAFVIVEAVLFWKGYDTNFWQHKTEHELAIQKGKLEGRVLVPKSATREIEDAIANSRNLKASEIWKEAIAAAEESKNGN